MSEDHIVLSGIKNPERVCRSFASNLVDVAYASRMTADQLRVEVDAGIDLRREDDQNWVVELIVSTLREEGEDEFETRIVLRE